VYSGPSLPDYRKNVDRACSFNVMCTGRLEQVSPGVEGVLALHGLVFDQYIFKPNDGQQYSRTNVKHYKKGVVSELLKDFPKVEELNFWDDRIDNIEAIKSLRRFHPSVKFNLVHVQQENPNIRRYYLSPPEEVFHNLGVLQDGRYKMAVDTVTEILKKAWLDVMSVKTVTQELMHFFGSHLLNRRSDVDVCLLAPSSRSPDECIEKLAGILKSYGFQFVHVATGIRCPRLKLKAIFCNYASVSFDIVVACVLSSLDSTDFDVVNAHKSCTDKQSKIALDGLVFATKIINPILDRISETDFGMLVETFVILLRRNRLKGNSFHCIRTFHLVQLLAEFVSHASPSIIPIEGLDTLKAFEKVFRSAVQYLALLPYEKYHSLFKGFVPNSFIQPLIDCFTTAKKLTIEDILFGGPLLVTAFENGVTVLFMVQAPRGSVQLWRSMSLLEARCGSFVRQLIDREYRVVPGELRVNSVCFEVNHPEAKLKDFDRHTKEFVKEFSKLNADIGSTLTYKLF